MKISIVIPVYNAAPFLEEAVFSAIVQPECGEILLIEDGSTDGSLAICERLASNSLKIKLLRHEDHKNHGAGASRNLGIVNSQFEWVAFLDADDFYLENRFAEQIKILEQQEVDLILSPVLVLHNGNYSMVKIHRELIAGLFLGGKYLGNTSSNLWRKSMLLDVGMFREDLVSCQDYDLMMRIIKANKTIGITESEPVCVHRNHDMPRISNQDKIKLSISGLKHRHKIWLLFKHEIIKYPKEYLNAFFKVIIDISYFSRHLAENKSIVKALIKELFVKNFFKLTFKHKIKCFSYSIIGYRLTENIINTIR